VLVLVLVLVNMREHLPGKTNVFVDVHVYEHVHVWISTVRRLVGFAFHL
jgi:hypothetical protein